MKKIPSLHFFRKSSKTRPELRNDTKNINKLDTSLITFADNVELDYLRESDPVERKKRGQFFTPGEVALFMAGQFDITKREIKLLDPGAGIGTLTAAFCECIRNQSDYKTVVADLYENDEKVIPYLERVLRKCKIVLGKEGHTFQYNIITKNFIRDNPNYFYSRTLFGIQKEQSYYDCVISNPPYYKLNIKSPEASLMKEFVSGQPNIYPFFMSLGLEMCKSDGQMVFITPRSFCSGLYFKRFRKWLILNSIIEKVHLFESRKDVFNKSGVLQENVIMKIVAKSPRAENRKSVAISISADGRLDSLRKIHIAYHDLFHEKRDDIFIKIPSSRSDIEIQHVMNNWGESLETLGLKVSTGPVVSFRANQYLTNEKSKECVPLLWMHNLEGFNVRWPIQPKGNKNIFITDNNRTKNILVKVRNIILLKRFTSKEQKKRLCAAVMLKSDFKFNKIGIENHLNYIYKQNEELDIEEVFGIAAVLNFSLLDKVFRTLNGNTQVNAVDVYNLPFPPLQKIRRIGKKVVKESPAIGTELDKIICEILGIDTQILGKTNKEL